MKTIFKKSLLALTCSSLLLLTACGGDGSDSFTGVKPDQTFISETPYKHESMAEADSIKVMTYNMVNVQGKTAKATAIVMFPKTPMPKDGYRTVVWEHGTLGVGDFCAPSNNVLGTNFRDPLAKGLLNAGYVIVAPDYEGMGTPGIHPYLHLKSEAMSAISAMKAAKDHYGSKLNGAWMSIGQSQGGQASLGTAQYAKADDSYKGAVAGAPASSLDTIIFDIAPDLLTNTEKQEIAAGTSIKDRPSVSAYSTLLSYAAIAAVGIKASDPRFDYREIFADPRSGDIAATAEGSTGENGLCLDINGGHTDSIRNKFSEDIIRFLTEDSSRRIMEYPGLDKAKFKASKQVQQFILDSQPGTEKIDKPILIIQGTLDMSVPYPVTKGLYDRMLAMKSNVAFLPVKDASHTQAIVWANADLMKFVQAHMPASN
ncbi:alpha/beta hydrolase [Acinetobacter chinensis]|uniref:Alpha/beta hydrolase n=1 Tax=Acinetobacter chinensis TaxID=2004650 RepID=A0ABU3WH77_9GAMM|nr:alpha/beta hydrolase [Acinetobacter chinensis]MDV2469760.1 alpha/beta hydrolase [Acinetobacter chinensis]